MATLANLLSRGGAPQEIGIPVELLASMFGDGSGRGKCFPKEVVAKCSEAGEHVLRDTNLRHALQDKHMGELSKYLPQKIQSMKTKYVLDREFIADKDDLPKWQLVRSENGHMDHMKTADYVQHIQGRVAINAACIEALEPVEALFTDASTKAMEAARSLIALNEDPSEDAMAEFKEGALKTYDDSMLTLKSRVSEIAGTISQQYLFRLLSGLNLGSVQIVLSPEQKGANKALDITYSSIKSLEKYERILRSCLAGIEATFEKVRSEGVSLKENTKIEEGSGDEEESSSEDDDLYT